MSVIGGWIEKKFIAPMTFTRGFNKDVFNVWLERTTIAYFNISELPVVPNSYTRSSHFVSHTGGKIWITRSSSYTPCKSRKCLKRSTNLLPINSEKLSSSIAFNQAILIHIIWVRSQSIIKDQGRKYFFPSAEEYCHLFT